MTSHKHSFQCFDAVVEKPYFTAVHNFASPQRSSFTSTNLEQPENRRCSFCSESQQAKQVTSEVSENHSAFWYQSPSRQHAPRRPMRPDGDPVDSVAHQHHNQRHYRHCKRIVLVKNSNPSIQKTILLHHKPVHSLSVFMDNVSELMHCLIRKLYTLDGRRVDSIQSLLQGPGVLVCVGREPFHPLFMDSCQKNSEDKLPNLILKPQSSTCKEDQGYKKNVNLGVKSKKSPGPFPKARRMLDDDIKKQVLVSEDGSLSMEMKVRFRLLNDETLHCSTEIKKSSCTFNVTFPGQDNVFSPHSSHGESCSEAESLSASNADDVCINRPYQKHLQEPHCQHCCTHCEEYDIWNNPALSEKETLRHIGSSCSSTTSHKIRYKKDSVDSVHTSCEEYTEQVVEKETCVQQTVEEGEHGDSIVRYCTISRCCSRSGVCSVSTKTKRAGFADEKHEENENPHACTQEVASKKTQNTIEDERPLSVDTNSLDILATFKEDEDKDECCVSTSTSRESQSNEENDGKERNVKVSPYLFTPCKPLESPKQPLSTRASSTASCCSVKSKSFRRFVVRETQETVDQDKNNALSCPPQRCQHKESTTDVAMETGISEEKLEAISQSKDVLNTKTGMRMAFDLSKTCDYISDDTVQISQADKKGQSRGMSTPPNRHAHLTNSSNSFVSEQECPNPIDTTGGYASKKEYIEAISLATFAGSDTSQSRLTKNNPEELSDVNDDENIANPLSPKSNVSAKSSQSRFSDVSCNETRDGKDDNTAENTEQLQKRYINVMACNPSDLDLSKTFITSEAIMEKTDDFRDKSEEQATSTMFTKSNTPTQRNMSEILETVLGGEEERPSSKLSSVSKESEKCMISEAAGQNDPTEKRLEIIKSHTGMGGEEERSLSAMSSKSTFSKQSEKVLEAAQECDHPENRPASIMSSTSVKSMKSAVSDVPCENKEDETKHSGQRSQNALLVKSPRSSKSKAQTSRKDKDEEKDKLGRAPSSISCKSILSYRSNLTPDGLDTGATDDLLQESDAYEKTKGERAASPMSSKSHMSSLSNKSNDQTQDRAKSNVTSELKKEKRSAEKILSPMSGKLDESKTLKKKSVLDCFEEPQKANTEEVVERSPSAVSAKSNTSVRSKTSDTQSNRTMKKLHLNTISPESKKSAKDETLNLLMMSNHSSNLNAIESEETCDIKIEKRASSSTSTKSSGRSRSAKSNISALSGGKTDAVNFNKRSDIALSGLKISMTGNTNNADNEERVSSALSKSSNTSSVHPTSERVLTPASASVSIGIVEEYDVDNVEEDSSVSFVSVHSTPQLNSQTDMCCKALSKATENKKQRYRQTPEDRAKSSTIQEFKEVANNKSVKKNSKKPSNHSLSCRSAHSDCVGRTSLAVTHQPNISDTLLHLEVNEKNRNTNGKCHSVGERSKSNLTSYRHFKKDKEKILRPHSAGIPATIVSGKKYTEPDISLGVSNNRPNPSNENNNKLNTTRDLNGSLVATDCSKYVIDDQSEKSSKSSCRQSSSSLAQKAGNNSCALVPSFLPSSSPTEVVNEWLEKIPLDSALYDVGDEFHENCKEEEPLRMSGEEAQYESGNGERDGDVAVPQNEQPGVNEKNESTLGDIKDTMQGLAGEENIQTCSFSEVPSSVLLMKILLSPKLVRCNSLPEVSPVYGKKLSTSARGFLDSLVNLQLLDFDPNDANGKSEKYNDLMNTLQSLWLCDPSDRVTIICKSKCNKQHSMNEKYNMKPSSGVELNSSSQDSGKSSANESTVARKSQTNTAGDSTQIFTNVQDIDTKEKTFNEIEAKSDPATPDIASRIRWTPEHEAEENMQDVSDLTDGIKNYPRKPPDTASISIKSSGNESSDNQKLTDHEEEDASLESQTSKQMAQLTEKVCQDPDPVWVINLLNKIEKQFMTHYVTAMVETKVRWNLSDNEQLDIMICELRDEVHKRIQASINDELRKIQGHAGRPKPPNESISREYTGQRRRRLKASLNQSIDPAVKADGDNSAKNDDEFCPCDTCMKKKASPRPVLAMDISNSAPKVLDFDLRNILQLKRNPSSNSQINANKTENKEQLTEVERKENSLVPDATIHPNKYEVVEEIGSVGGETLREYMAFEAGIDDKEDVSEVETSSVETRDATAEDKTLESEGNEATEGEISESLPEEEGETYNDENKKHAVETTWKNMPEKPDTAVGKELTEVEEDHKSERITHLTVKDDDAETGKSESTDTEQRDGNDSAEEDVYKKTISKENSEDDLFDEEKVSEPTEDEDITEHESAEEPNGMNDESAKEGETDIDELDGEVTETTEDRETSRDNVADVGDMGETKAKEDDDYESGEATKTSNSQTAEDTSDDETEEYTETPKAQTTEIEISGDGYADDEKADDKVAGDAENRDKDHSETSEIEETAFNETLDSVNTTKTNTAEYYVAHDDGTSDEGDPAGAAVVEDEESDEATIIGNYNKDDERAEEPERSNTQVAEEIADNDIVKDGETLETEAVKHFVRDKMDAENVQKTGQTLNKKTANAIANDETADSIEIDTSQSDDDGETDDDESDNGESAGDGTAEAAVTLNNKTFDDGTAEDKETPNKKTADHRTVEDGQPLNDDTADEFEPSEDSETANANTSDDGTAEDRETPNDNKVEGGTVEDGQTLNDDTADGGPSEDRETANDTADEGTYDEGTEKEEKLPKSNMEELNETTDAETAEDNGRADGQTVHDEETSLETSTEAKNEENEETAESKTEEDGETADCETFGELAKGPIEKYATTDESESVENGETPEKLNGETNESNATEVVINTHNIKTKQNSEVMHLYQDTETCESKRFNTNIHSVNTGESDEGGDEAEDDTEPIVATYGRAQGITTPATHSRKWPPCKDDQADKRTITSFESTVKMYTRSEDGEDADGEDSETEVHNKDVSVENDED